MDFQTAVKLNIYETVAETTRVPTSAEVAAALGRSAGEVKTAFRQLAQKRLLVLEPGDDSRIRMAPPFSGFETPSQNMTPGARCWKKPKSSLKNGTVPVVVA